MKDVHVGIPRGFCSLAGYLDLLVVRVEGREDADGALVHPLHAHPAHWLAVLTSLGHLDPVVALCYTTLHNHTIYSKFPPFSVLHTIPEIRENTNTSLERFITAGNVGCA